MIKFEQAYQEIKSLIANEIFDEIEDKMQEEVKNCNKILENITTMPDYDVLFVEGRRSALLEMLDFIHRFKRNVWNNEYD